MQPNYHMSVLKNTNSTLPPFETLLKVSFTRYTVSNIYPGKIPHQYIIKYTLTLLSSL